MKSLTQRDIVGCLALFVAALSLLFISCDSGQETSATQNPLKSNIEAEVTDVLYGKNVKNGMLVRAKVICPPYIRSDQIKLVALEMFKELKAKYPKCEWFFVWISDDQRMYKAGNYIAVAEYKEGITCVTGGIPSEKEISESGNVFPIIKPTDQGMDIYYEFTKIKDDAFSQGKYLSDKEVYPLLSKKFKMPISEISRIHRGIGHYYMLKSGNKL